jgi:predicted MPP superfamily phosphohydrolase
MYYLLLAVAAIGHVILWTACINRLHGLGMNRRLIDAGTAASGIMLGTAPVAIAIRIWQQPHAALANGSFLGTLASLYVAACALFCAGAAIHRFWLMCHPERSGILLANLTNRADLRFRDPADVFAPGIPRLIGRLPGNQVLDLHIHEKQLVVPRLDPALDGVRIAHISDLHMSGRVTKPHFVEIVDQVNQLKADLVALTGDLVEANKCLEWLPDTLGSLHAPSGVFFVLGNHDRRVNQARLTDALQNLPLIHLGGQCRQIFIRNMPVILAGNELPWYGPAPDLKDLSFSKSAPTPLKILLAHGPDQFGWAVDHDFDLMLAGHNHGGQVRMPGLGAVLTPSRSGTRYASGVFCRGQSVLHVSRGTSSLTPLRWNCPPEIAILVLRSRVS